MPGDMSLNESELNINRGADIGTPVEHMPKPRHARERAGGAGNYPPGRVEGEDPNKHFARFLVPGGARSLEYINTPQEVKAIIRRLAERPDILMSPQALEDVYNDLDNLVRNSTYLDDSAIDMYKERIGLEYQRRMDAINNPPTRSTGGPNPQTGGTFAQDLAMALYGERLSKQEKYLELLDDEQWNNDPIQPINPDNAPSFYIEMTNDERELHQIRVELNNACYLKRNKGFTLEALSKEVPYGGLSKTETERLYNEIPGLRQAAKMYISLIDQETRFTNEAGVEFTILTAKSRADLLIIREEIRKNIQNSIRQDVREKIALLDMRDRDKYEKRDLDKLDDRANRDILMIKCRDAEQVAFNLLFLGNTFEALDSRWDNGVRTRGQQIGSELVITPIRNAMKPLDYLIASFGKKT